MKTLEQKINKAINESINAFLIREGIVDTFTPYTPEQAKKNREAMLVSGENNRPIGERNKSYGDFIAWRREQMANGVPSVEASYANYLKQK